VSDDNMTPNEDLSDDFLFDDSGFEEKLEIYQNKWKILVVDDEPEVFQVTALALKDFNFSDKGLELIPAYSGNEAMELIKKHPDIALILLDVVMESEHAGLELVRWIRDEQENSFVRIILRTGQPGQANPTHQYPYHCYPNTHFSSPN